MTEPTLTPEQKNVLMIAARRLGEAAGRTSAASRQAILGDPAQLEALAAECDSLGGGASGLAAEFRSLQQALTPAEPAEDRGSRVEDRKAKPKPKS